MLARVSSSTFSPVAGSEALGHMAEPHLEEIGELRHGPTVEREVLMACGLLDGDGWADVLDRVNPGLGEEVEELAGVGAEGST